MPKVGLGVMGLSVELHKYCLEMRKRARVAWQQARETQASEARASWRCRSSARAACPQREQLTPWEREVAATSRFLSL